MNMEETEELSKPDENVVAETGDEPKADAKVLISPERAQQFQLLIHLISNRQQPLVLSGPEGIGKTTAIDLLHQRKGDSWQICTVEAKADLDLDQIQQVLIRSVEKKDPDLNGCDWTEILAHYEKSGQKLVLILDEAGMLAPGMMGELCKFSEIYPIVRIVFALTPDQLHVVNSSDKSIYDCFFIEFPPLTEKQCGDFLQNLSCRPGAAVTIKSINPEMVENLYRETHGIPGRIVKAFSGSSRFSSTENESSGSSLLLGSVLIAAVVGFVWWTGGSDAEHGSSISENGSMKTISAPAFNTSEQKKVEIKIVEPAEQQTASLQKTDEKELFSGVSVGGIDSQAKNSEAITISQETKPVYPVENIKEKTDAEKDVSESASGANVELKKINPAREADVFGIQSIKKVPDVKSSVEESALEATGDEDVDKNENKAVVQGTSQQPNDFEEPESHLAANLTQSPSTEEIEAAVNSNTNLNWVLQQPSTNFTLQLMVLSRLDSLMDVIQKYPKLQQDFRYFKMPRPGKTKYYVLYGSFDSRSEAVRTMQSLPKELQQAWMRRFSGIQNKISANSAN